MRRLRVTFPTSLSDKDEALRGEVYWEEFNRIGIEAFEYAVKESIGALSFFPKPNELWEFIDALRRNQYLSHQAEMPELPKIGWQEPTEEGRRIAKEIIGELYNTWGEQDKKREQERAEKFEKNREHLKKQAKLIKGGAKHGDGDQS
jgi:hypothetical protein